mmetsp:Transcript_63307/g.137731  ORF Transcript_63307/g.137731 Transcript_63307/m.137731 type:complete len:155 (+) Transcript_63307:197-661(+)
MGCHEFRFNANLICSRKAKKGRQQDSNQTLCQRLTSRERHNEVGRKAGQAESWQFGALPSEEVDASKAPSSRRALRRLRHSILALDSSDSCDSSAHEGFSTSAVKWTCFWVSSFSPCSWGSLFELTSCCPGAMEPRSTSSLSSCHESMTPWSVQ